MRQPHPATVIDFFEAQVVKTPNNLALAYEETELTYAELNERANRVAHFLLRQKKVGVDELVGVMIERSEWMLVAVLGLLKAGCAYLPIDPAYPVERQVAMLRDSACRVLLTTNRLESRVGGQVDSLCDVSQVGAGQPSFNPRMRASANRLAYVIYTSGSSGTPKGVMIEHGNLMNTLGWRQSFYGFSPADVNLQIPSLSFDSSVVDIFSILISGGRLILLKEESRTNLEYLEQLINRHKVSRFLVVPSFYRVLLTELDNKLAGLKTITLAGEAVSIDLVESHFACLPGVGLVNEYGPTENTVCSTACYLRAEERAITIGKSISNVTAYILNERLEKTVPGEHGEICLAGKGLARGYWRNASLTAEKFIPNPYGGPGERLYRTGDLGRINEDGNIEFLGRIDRQVKIRGHRIELGEIENLLLQHPRVKESAVEAREVIPSQKELVAYIRSDDDLPSDELKKHLGDALPGYMMPSHFVFLRRFPRSPNGKLDRHALPNPTPELKREYIAPATSLQKEMAEVMQNLLGIKQIGMEDNFFELGAHSLIVSQFVARINRIPSCHTTIKDLFAGPTIAELSRKIETCPAQVSNTFSIPIISRDSRIPLTFQQEQVWFLHKLVPENVAYNAQFTIHFTGDLDKEILEKSLSEIIKRHEILRTTFPEVDGEPVQRIHVPWEAKIQETDLRHLPVTERERRAEQLIQHELSKPFDYTRLPLIRWYLYRLSEQESILLNVEFHFVHDGWSVAVFLRELKALYNAYRQGAPSTLEDVPLQLADYAAWQRGVGRESVLQHQLEYWVKELEGHPPVLNLHTDKPRPKSPSLKGGMIEQDLPVELYRSLRSFSRQHGVTLFTTLFAAFSNLLFQYTGQKEILVGTAVANRTSGEMENVLGMLVNMLPLRSDLSGNPSFIELLSRTRESLFQALAHQDVPLQLIVEKLQPARVPGMNPLFQTIFSFHDSPVPDLDFDGATGRVTIRHTDSAKVDINVICVPIAEQRIGRDERQDNDRLTLMWEYNSDLFDRETMQRMVDNFIVMLRAIVARPEAGIGRIEMLSNEERARVLHEFNNTEVDYPAEKTIQRLFEEQVERTPDNIAIICEERELTYRQLNASANRLAHYLRTRHGIEADELVGLMVDRSERMVVGIMGILKAGGAYLPLDPADPESRLAYKVSDAGAKVILTEAKHSQKLTAFPQPVILLDSLENELSTYPETNPQSTNTSDDLLYAIYTSGSTGKPRGVLATHRSVVNLVNWYATKLSLAENDCMLLIAPLSFDLAQKNLFAPLSNGASVCLSERIIGDYPAIADCIARQRVSLVNATPSALYPLFETEDFEKLHSLRKVIFGGEPVRLKKLLRWLASPHCRAEIINGYGPTECSGVVCAYSLNGGAQKVEQLPIGKPINNTLAYILTAEQQLLPTGIPGEIHIGGAGLTRGYLNHESLTREKFIPNPFRAGESFYRTGDIGRWLPDGNIEFMGRNDEQTKVRGYRIEPGEIEAALESLEKISGAVVLATADNESNNCLTAYLVGLEKISVTEIRSHLKRTLTEYMIPTRFVQVESFPLTRNGKIDRVRLQALEEAGMDTGIAYVEPGSETERRLAAVWQEVLGVERVGTGDDFFALGGHSLLVTRVISRVREIFKLELPINSMFEDPTLAGFAERIDTLLWSRTSVQTSASGPTLYEEMGEI